jgi:hypothetical protein
MQSPRQFLNHKRQSKPENRSGPLAHWPGANGPSVSCASMFLCVNYERLLLINQKKFGSQFPLYQKS